MQTYRRKLKLNVEDTNCNNAHMFAENLQLTFSIHFPPLLLLHQIGHMLWQDISIYFLVFQNRDIQKSIEINKNEQDI